MTLVPSIISGTTYVDNESKAKLEYECLTEAIYFEAGIEPLAGKLAVGHVIMNRVADKRYANNICDVVHQKNKKNQCQFSYYCDGKSDKPYKGNEYLETLDVATYILHHDPMDITEGALYYHAYFVNPSWNRAMTHVMDLGKHKFYRDSK